MVHHTVSLVSICYDNFELSTSVVEIHRHELIVVSFNSSLVEQFGPKCFIAGSLWSHSEIRFLSQSVDRPINI